MSITNAFSRGTVASLSRKAISQGVLFGFKEDVNKVVSEAFPELSKTQTTSISSFILGCLGETVTNWIDRIRVLRQDNLTISKLDALKEALKEPFKGAFKASIKKGISRSIYITGLEIVLRNWEQIEEASDTFINAPGVMDKAESFLSYFAQEMGPEGVGGTFENLTHVEPDTTPSTPETLHEHNLRTQNNIDTSKKHAPKSISSTDAVIFRAKSDNTSKSQEVRPAEPSTKEID